MHRFLLCMLLLSLIAAVQPTAYATENMEAEETWSVSSDEGGNSTSYLGVDIADVTPERLSDLKLKEEHGAEITMVDADAPAGKAGLHEHDVILSLNGTAIESAAQLRRMIKETPPGRVITLGISRDGQPMTIKTQLADRKMSNSWWPDGHGINVKIPPIPPIPEINVPVSVVMAYSSMRSGLMVENITPQLGEFFGVKGGKGVLIRSVEKGSRGEKAGFRAGDVIVKVNEQLIHDTSDFNHALRGSSGNTVAITVMRDKREQNLTLPLPDKKDSGELFEDSFAMPEISVETQFAIDSAQGELAGLGHAMDMDKLQHEMEQAAKAQKHSQECLERRQKELQKQMEHQQQRMLERQQKMQERQEKLRHEMDGSWAEI